MNETVITLGQSEADVRALLGDPTHVGWALGLRFWSYGQGPALATTPVLYFSGKGTVEQIGLDTPGETVETVVAANGPPELVLIYPIPDPPTPMPDMTPIPIADPHGQLLYLSKGLYFEFACSAYGNASCLSVKYCTGVAREARVHYKMYFEPITITDWKKSLRNPDNTYCLRPWSGFAD